MYEELVKRLREAPSDWPDADLHYEAADAIEDLTAQLDQANEVIKADTDYIFELSKPEWIPVTERLPEEGKFVLVYGDLYSNKHDGGVIAVSKRIDWNYWQGFGRERNITHWMPLPEPPKEET